MAEQAGVLGRAVRWRVLGKYLGQASVVLAILAVVPALVSAAAWQWPGALRLAAVGVGFALLGLLGRIRASDRLQANEALVLAPALFVMAAVAMSWPMAAAGGLPWIDGLFEAVSGVTTTGLTTTATVADKPAEFLFARAWMQWYGGLGIVALTVVLVAERGLAGKRLSIAEHHTDDPVGSTKAHFRQVLVVYVVLTVVGIGLLWVLGAGLGDACLYALAAVSTGGYAPHDGSLAGLPGWPARAAVLVLCTGGAVSLVVYRQLWGRAWRRALAEPQWRALLILGVVSSALVAGLLLADGAGLGGALRLGAALGFSAQTTSGFAPGGALELEGAPMLVVICSMLTGGSLGSTAGGIKMLRLLVLASIVRVSIVRTCLPSHAVLETRLGGRRLEVPEIRDAMVVTTVFSVVVAVSWVLFVAAGYEPLAALFEVASATGTVGLSAGITRPELETPLKLLLCGDMLMGRLEVVAWLVLLYPRTWWGRRVEDS